MIFKVSPELKGSVLVKFLGAPLVANRTVAIEGNDLLSNEVKALVKAKVLIPQQSKEYKKISHKSSQVGIVNQIDRVLILNDVILRPGGSLIVENKFLESEDVQRAIRNRLVEVVSQDTEPVGEPELSEEEKVQQSLIPSKDRAEEGDVEPKVWDFRQQSLEDAVPVPKASVKEVEIEEMEEDVPAKKKVLKKKAKSKTKKATAQKKKKVKSSKKKKISKKAKVLEPVGEKKRLPTAAEADGELDSRGKPVATASDALHHMIKEVTGAEDVPFVDQEQEIKRIQQRSDINIDLDD